ncbi:MAG: sodium:solute symporter family protein [Candidatus Glassbacteria bacterium]|nr:sodium:solute symporter family protein [Candidatus Glassbacteria bacterium]
MHWLDFTVIGVYMLGVAGIGVWTSRMIRGTDDYFLGGRSFGKVFAIFLQFGTGTSSDMPVSVSRESFRNGMSGIWAVLLWLFITPFYWIIGPWYRRLRMVTIGDFFAERFQSKALGAAYAAFSVFYFMYYIAIGLTAVGKTVEVMTPIPESSYSAEQLACVEAYRNYAVLEREFEEGRELGEGQLEELELLREQNQAGAIQSQFSYLDSHTVVPAIAVVILVYAILGGLKAAVITDFIQGVLIIVLSFIIIPFGLREVGWFSGLHQRVPEHMFNLLGSQQTSDYSLLFIVSIVLINLVGIVVQPHMIQVCGSARDETAARVGLTYGNYLKRLCTVGWALVGVIGFALYAHEVSDPDMIWGYTTLKLLPVGIVGLMIAAMLAAIMSSADAFMVSGSALFTMNLYRPLRPASSDSHLVWVGRITTAFIIIGGVVLSQRLHSVIELLKYIWTLPVIFGAVFWLSFLWRRVTLPAAWCSVVFTLLFSFVLPVVLPLSDRVATRESLLEGTAPQQVEVLVGADSSDVAAGLADKIGELINKQGPVPSTPIFFRQLRTGRDGGMRGEGKFRTGVWLLTVLGADFRNATRATLEAATFLMDAVLPFIVLFVVSLLTAPVEPKALQRFYSRVHTPVHADPELDRRELDASYADPERHAGRILFPGTNWMMLRPDRADILGFVAATVVAGAIVGLVFLVAGITWP